MPAVTHLFRATRIDRLWAFVPWMHLSTFFVLIILKKVPAGSLLFPSCAHLAQQVVFVVAHLYFTCLVQPSRLGVTLDPLTFSSGTVSGIPARNASVPACKWEQCLAVRLHESVPAKDTVRFSERVRKNSLNVKCCSWIAVFSCHSVVEVRVRKVFSVAAGNLHVVLNSWLAHRP